MLVTFSAPAPPPAVMPPPVTTWPKQVHTAVPSVTVLPIVVGQVGSVAPTVPPVVHL